MSGALSDYFGPRRLVELKHAQLRPGTCRFRCSVPRGLICHPAGHSSEPREFVTLFVPRGFFIASEPPSEHLDSQLSSTPSPHARDRTDQCAFRTQLDTRRCDSPRPVLGTDIEHQEVDSCFLEAPATLGVRTRPRFRLASSRAASSPGGLCVAGRTGPSCQQVTSVGDVSLSIPVASLANACNAHHESWSRTWNSGTLGVPFGPRVTDARGASCCLDYCTWPATTAGMDTLALYTTVRLHDIYSSMRGRHASLCVNLKTWPAPFPASPATPRRWRRAGCGPSWPARR